MYPTDLKVGEIVVLKPKGKHSNPEKHDFIAFIEEVIVEPTPISELNRYGFGSERTHSGVYSLYGFEQNHFLGYPDWYVGDTLGDDFERTGKMVTVDDLKRLYAKVGDTDPKFKEDILTVTKNLGRMSARNEERELIVS